MSTESQEHSFQEQWAACVGNFAVLKDFLKEKETPFWIVIQLLDAFLRGFGQVLFANNPISGILIAITLAATMPMTFIFSAATGFLGLLLSVLICDSQDTIENGLTVYNPVLIGAASYTLIPQIYGSFDAFSILLVLLATIFCVYLTCSLGNNKYSCTMWPFILAEFAILFVLAAHDGPEDQRTNSSILLSETNNATSDATHEAVFITENGNAAGIDWGMIFRGIAVSPSQVFIADNVALGSVIYLAVLLYSPTTAGFSFLGALIGSLAGLELGVPLEEVYSGFWGFNGLLTGACLGGNLLILNGQTAAATLTAIVYTIILQYVMQLAFNRVGIPLLTLPFVLASSLFLQLGNSNIFPRPASFSFPEKQRHDYLAHQISH